MIDWFNTSRTSTPVCPIEGSSTTLTFMFDTNVYNGEKKVDSVRRKNIRQTSNFNVELTIYNVTTEDEGLYRCYPVFDHNGVMLEVAKLWFKNQMGTPTIVGQEGITVEINCSTDTEQYITALKLESNGSTIAVGDNLSVSYSFIPDRTDHLTKYKCVEGTQSSIMIETTLFIRCPPVFSAENIIVIQGEVGQSITLSFYIYSYPDVDEIVIEKIGRKQSRNKQIKNFSISTYTLLYTEFENIVGIEGYKILIERKALELDDFQTYRITAKNQLGKSNYNFEIIDIENIMLSKGKRRYFVILIIIATVLFVYLIIIHVLLCVRYIQTMDERNNIVLEDHDYHAYDDIGTMSTRSFGNLRSAGMFRNQGQNLTNQNDILTSVYLQSINEDSTTELNTTLSADGLHRREITEQQDHRMSISSYESIISNTDLSLIPPTAITKTKTIINQTYTSTDIETSNSQPIHEYESETSSNVMVDDVGDGYENTYHMV
ncbi:Hypothetical predicted protein [Mytilus galloprovincialis]|uniref:Ig-like domain-containing protein n=1 Tax=Mytilus galloprovincialis TaxID=29158 RepID=A0A8B6FCR8_MYTGA|nr:Hypothetical predicted protein [Mytilus galloprovincialis]